MNYAVEKRGDRYVVLADDAPVSEHDTSSQAWREVDRLENAPVNRQQVVSDWIAWKTLRD